MMTNPSVLSDFHLFSKLPIEMRSMVWKQTLPPARAVQLCLKKIPQKDGSPEVLNLYSPCATPIALRVCKESRAEALLHYQLAFGNQYHSAQIYIDFSCDVVYLVWKESHMENEVHVSPQKLHTLLSNTEANKIKYMAVSSIYSETIQELIHFQNFLGLKELWVEFESRDILSAAETAGSSPRQTTLIEEEEFRMRYGYAPIDDMEELDRAFVLETFHEARKVFPEWKAPSLRFVSSGVEV